MNLKQFLEFVKQQKFIEHYAGINYRSGISHRLSGNGTNAKDKKKELTEEDKTAIKAGLKQFINDAKTVMKSL